MPTLSLCLIARNEEQNIERCLSSVRGLVDEIIVVDTGSTDRTKEIVRRFTEKIFDLPWNNDFAAAKNEALKQATGDWILVLDADEGVSSPDHDRIKEALRNPSAIAFTFILRNYTNDARAAGWTSREGDSYEESLAASGWWEVPKIRLFKNNLGITYSGKIHESVYPSIQGTGGIQGGIPGEIMALSIPIHHYGHLDLKRQAQKKTIYEQLQKEKIGVGNGAENDYYSHFELARQLLMNNKVDEAKQAVETSLQHNGHYFQSWFLLGTIHLLQEKWDEALAALERAWILNPGFGATSSNLGIVYARKKLYQQAIEQFLQAIELNPKDANAWKNLGLCFDEMGEKEKAYRALKRAVELNPAYKEIIKLEL